jgi:hypothetical protein
MAFVPQDSRPIQPDRPHMSARSDTPGRTKPSSRTALASILPYVVGTTALALPIIAGLALRCYPYVPN